MPGNMGTGGSSRHGILGSAMPPSSTSAACSGGTGGNLRNSCLPWRCWKISLKPLASAAFLPEQRLKILESTVQREGEKDAAKGAPHGQVIGLKICGHLR